MKLLNKTKNLREVVRARFEDMEKLTLDEIVQEYIEPKNPYIYLQARLTVRSMLYSIKRWFRVNHGLWFGNLDNEGHFGLVETEAEARFALMRYYRLVKGNIFNAGILVTDAGNKGLLPSGMIQERLLVARIGEEDEKRNKTRTGK